MRGAVVDGVRAAGAAAEDLAAGAVAEEEDSADSAEAEILMAAEQAVAGDKTDFSQPKSILFCAPELHCCP